MKEKLNTKQGISLIVLVITIIVIIILAVAVILTLANNNPIENAKQAVKDNDKATLKEEATLLYADWYLKENSPGGEGSSGFPNDAQGYVMENLSDGYTAELKEKLTVSNDGKITIGEESASAKQWALPENDKKVDVGDLLTPTVEGLKDQKFYVIADDGTTLTLLSEKNVDTSENKQAPGNNPVAFDEDSNVYKGSDIQGLVNAYIGTLTGLDLEDVEVAYGAEPESNVKGRLMWKDEAENATFKAATNYSDILYGPSGAKINYWLGSPYQDSADYAWFVDGNSGGLYDSDVSDDHGLFGLRPVIKILKSNV